MRTRRLPSVMVAAILLAGTFTTFGRAPIATNDTYAVSKSATLTITAPGVLANDTPDNLSQTLIIASLASQTFTFDGITFDQALTPNQIFVLSAGTYSNAVVTALPQGTSSNPTGFPESLTSFLPGLSAGHLYADTTDATLTKAVNLPQGNLGANHRSGIELRWAAGVTLTNLTGDEFVVFETGSTGAPEAFMVQVHNSVDDVWSPWVYAKAQSFKFYNASIPGDGGLHSTKFNLDSFGIVANGQVDRIRIVNMTPKDRMVNASGEGIVLADDNGATSVNLPLKPNSTPFGNLELDPDIVYVGSLHPLQATIPAYAATSELGAPVILNADGSFTYNPGASPTLQNLGPGQSAVDTFYYLITDSVQGYARGLVSITVSGPPAPALTIMKSGNNVIIKWPDTAGFLLQSTDSLTDPEWADVEIEPTEDDGDLSVTIDASTGNSFFRLVSRPPI
jgi:VCBS repeat-containing protein